MGTDQPAADCAGLVSALCRESRRSKAARRDLLQVALLLPAEPEGEDLALYSEALDRLAHVVDNQAVLVAHALQSIQASQRYARAELLRALSEAPQRYRLPP